MSLTAEQLNERHNGIGSSDAPAILGLSPWKSPLELWAEKSADEPVRIEENPAMRWGSLLEPLVANEYSALTGNAVRRRPMLRSKEFPFMTANLDRTVDGKPIIVECKTTGRSDGWGEPDTNEVPPYILTQCYHQLAVAENYEVVHVPVLFLHRRQLEIYRVERDESVIARLKEKEQEFWDMVETGVQPEASTLKDVQLLYPQDDGTVMLSDELRGSCEQLAAIKSNIKALGAQADALELVIKTGMGEHSQLLDEAGEPLATWKASTSRRLDQKALKAEHPDIVSQYQVESSSRRFLLKVRGD